MIVKCEKCQVGFNVKESLIKKAGSKFRCSKCNHIFTIFPPAPDKTGDKRPAAMADLAQKSSDKSCESGERYVDMESIGKGGMGEVLLAKDTQLRRKVAIKVLKEEVASPEILSLFVREAQVSAQLDHPNIVPIYTVKQPGEGEKYVSFVMKLIKGQDLFEIISKSRKCYVSSPREELDPELRLRSRLEYFLKVCEGISYAHSKNVIHRDLKPANVMIGDYGEVYIMDWGIAKVIGTGVEIEGGIASQAEGVVGTPTYMSPEQSKGQPDVQFASDIFSLGAVLYELVTLKPARPGDTSTKMQWAEEGYLNDLIHVSPEEKIDPELKAIINKATEINPEDRYSNVAVLGEDVRCYLRGEEVSEFPDNARIKLWRWMSKNRELSLIVLLASLLIFASSAIGGLFWALKSNKEARFRESVFSELQAKVSEQAYKIDIHFLRLEELAVNLANNAMYLVEDAPRNDERFYWISDFKDPRKAPPDLAHSKLYRRPVSIDYPVVKPAPGIRLKDVEPIMKRLAPLRHHFKKTLLDSRNSLAPVGDEEARRLLTVHGLPIRWAFIGLEAGVMYSYPGKSTYSDDYDPRVRPWYDLGAKKNAVFWGNPYPDIQGQGLVLPCAAPLYDKENQFFGVVGMDVTFSDIIRENLTRTGARGIIESFLLDDKGNVVVKQSQLYAEVEEQTDDPSLELEPFHVREVIKKINSGKSGLTEVKEQGKIIVFYKMPSLEWYYVEELDASIVLKKGRKEN